MNILPCFHVHRKTPKNIYPVPSSSLKDPKHLSCSITKERYQPCTLASGNPPGCLIPAHRQNSISNGQVENPKIKEVAYLLEFPAFSLFTLDINAMHSTYPVTLTLTAN